MQGNSVSSEPLVNVVEIRPKRTRRQCLCSCLSYTLVGVAGFLLGAPAGGAATAKMLHDANNATLPTPHTCPGLCASRALHGEFAANVTSSHQLGPVTIEVSFYIRHKFDWDTRSVSMQMTPTSVKPSWAVKLYPISCDRVPFAIGDACNMTVFTDDCLSQEQAADKIVGWTYAWDGGDGLAVTQTLDGGMFKHTFAWDEKRTA